VNSGGCTARFQRNRSIYVNKGSRSVRKKHARPELGLNSGRWRHRQVVLSMDNKKNCAERMRPILQAMERSIDQARRARTNSNPANDSPLRNSLAASPLFTPSPLTTPTTTQMDAGPPRLKARPKPLNPPILNAFQQSPYRSQAG